MAVLPDPRHETFCDWLVTAPREREITTLSALGESLGVSRRTLHDWKQRPEFRAEWDSRAVAVAGDPERTQRILDALYEVGTDTESPKQVPAAKAWADIAGVIKPPKKDEGLTGAAMLNLDPEELDKLLIELLQNQDAQ